MTLGKSDKKSVLSGARCGKYFKYTLHTNVHVTSSQKNIKKKTCRKVTVFLNKINLIINVKEFIQTAIVLSSCYEVSYT